ncbi:hypothetical protein BC834DRAFT_873832 [Gloeopeniophorella convolvens]|nr:hypothetical protein BC834DRAFT_873832 [Gloeopeniophorella convolvens]
MHFSHVVRVPGRGAVTRRALLVCMERYAGVLGVGSGCDLVIPFLFGASYLQAEQLGCVIVRATSLGYTGEPDAALFERVDPFECGVFDETDRDVKGVPLVRIVFALGAEAPGIVRMSYEKPEERAGFTSYDYWCSGASGSVLRPVPKRPDEWLVDKAIEQSSRQ